MSLRRLARSIRVRLTLWYAIVLTAILFAYAGGTYLFLRQNLYAELDRQLHDDLEVVEESLEWDEAGALRRRDRGGSYAALPGRTFGILPPVCRE